MKECLCCSDYIDSSANFVVGGEKLYHLQPSPSPPPSTFHEHTVTAMSTSAASRRNGHDGARKRVGFTLGGGSGDITPIDGDGTNLNNDNILLDDQGEWW